MVQQISPFSYLYTFLTPLKQRAKQFLSLPSALKLEMKLFLFSKCDAHIFWKELLGSVLDLFVDLWDSVSLTSCNCSVRVKMSNLLTYTCNAMFYCSIWLPILTWMNKKLNSLHFQPSTRRTNWILRTIDAQKSKVLGNTKKILSFSAIHALLHSLV